MEFRLLLKIWMGIPFYIKLLGLVSFFLVISFLTYQISQINVQFAGKVSFEAKSLKCRIINCYILVTSALIGILGFSLGPLLISFPYNFQYLISMTLTGLFSLSAVYSMWSLHPRTPGIAISETRFFKRLVGLPVMFFKILHNLVGRVIQSILAPGKDLWGFFIGLSFLLLLPYGFASGEMFLKVICLTLGGMGLTLAFYESLTSSFNYSFFPEPVVSRQKQSQLILGVMGFFLGVALSESLFVVTLQDYYLIFGGIVGLFTGVGVGLPLSQAQFYHQQLQRERERQKQAEKSEGEKLLTKIIQRIEEYRRLPLLSSPAPLADLEVEFQSLKTEFLSGARSFPEFRETALRLENQLKGLIRAAQKTQSAQEERVVQPVGDVHSIQSIKADQKETQPDQEEKAVQPTGEENHVQLAQTGQKTRPFPKKSQELVRSLEQTITETRKLIDELKAKNAGGGAILSNTLALEARLNGLQRKLGGRRISLVNALTDAMHFKEAAEKLSYYVTSTQSAEGIKLLTEAECRQILNVSPEASLEEIKKAYKELAKLYHPDKFVNSPPEVKEKADKAFKKLNEAYRILTRPTTL